MTRARKSFGPEMFHRPDVTPDKPEKPISPENPVSWNFGKKLYFLQNTFQDGGGIAQSSVFDHQD